MIIIRLRHILNSKGITQSELAKATRIRPSTICDLYNNNASFLKLNNLYKICNFLNCKVEELIEIKNE